MNHLCSANAAENLTDDDDDDDGDDDDDDDDDDDVDVVDDDGDDVGATCVMIYVQNVCFLLLYFQDFCK